MAIARRTCRKERLMASSARPALQAARAIRAAASRRERSRRRIAGGKRTRSGTWLARLHRHVGKLVCPGGADSCRYDNSVDPRRPHPDYGTDPQSGNIPAKGKRLWWNAQRALAHSLGEIRSASFDGDKQALDPTVIAGHQFPSPRFLRTRPFRFYRRSTKKAWC